LDFGPTNYLADPDNERAFLTTIASAVGHAAVNAQGEWLDAHSDILIDTIASRISSKVKVNVVHQLPVP
jgi:hypothetical protein